MCSSMSQASSPPPSSVMSNSLHVSLSSLLLLWFISGTALNPGRNFYKCDCHVILEDNQALLKKITMLCLADLLTNCLLLLPFNFDLFWIQASNASVSNVFFSTKVVDVVIASNLSLDQATQCISMCDPVLAGCFNYYSHCKSLPAIKAPTND
ncbi:uncharacterized protein LOC125539683 [Triticum urartu]|uniref:uncharacterized protein LOC125539683 n=1 Tax=Triticum urartu TaxID=4572 RepID=UPI002042DABB|nr:uncharacterized protein LOC125539683 [Triticum urartu]